MTINDIKNHINKIEGSSISKLLMQQQTTTVAGSTEVAKTDWFSHWEAPQRVRVTMHKDTFNALKADHDKGDLVQKLVVVEPTATKKGYHHYFVSVPKDVAGVF